MSRGRPEDESRSGSMAWRLLEAAGGGRRSAGGSRFPLNMPGLFSAALGGGQCSRGSAAAHDPRQPMPGVPDDGLYADEGVTFRAPDPLHTAFDPREVSPWEESRFETIKKLYDAKRNQGEVILMRDRQDDQLIAVKQMPNTWIHSCYDDFMMDHPTETEVPWQDIGCTRFLNSVDFPYGCNLKGVCRGPTHTYVLTSFATEGDLFTCAQAGVQPGPERELAFAPLVVQLISGINQLHDMQIVHRDISLENVLLTQNQGKEGLPGCFDRSKVIRIIDYGMASTGRSFRDCVRGKASYQAPEMHNASQEYDAFLSDTFSLGVILYALLLKDYPWLSTRPGGCNCFGYVQKHGFRSYCAKRKVRGSEKRVADCISEDFMKLMEGMFAIDPANRLTLGEKSWPADRRSVWDEPFMKQCLEIASRGTTHL